MNSNDVVEHIEGCAYCQSLEDKHKLTPEQVSEQQIDHYAERRGHNL